LRNFPLSSKRKERRSVSVFQRRFRAVWRRLYPHFRNTEKAFAFNTKENTLNNQTCLALISDAARKLFVISVAQSRTISRIMQSINELFSAFRRVFVTAK
jgi:hypothetical protein